AAYSVLHGELLTLPTRVSLPLAAQVSMLLSLLAKATVRVLTAYGLMAGLDLALTHLRFNRQMRMTKEEAKREYKQDEGDPLIRNRRRRRHREMVKARVAVEVPRADAIIVNPTHIAIAIRYRKGEGG